MKKTLLGLSLLTAFATIAHENHKHNDKTEIIGAHVHGEGTLNIVVEDNKLLLNLVSPAINILGFEHHPENDTQHRKVDNAITTLQQADKLFDTANVQCHMSNILVEMPFANDAHKEHEHADIHAKYEMTCDKIDTLEKIEVGLFKAFSGFEKINVQWIMNDKQGATTLLPNHSHIHFD